MARTMHEGQDVAYRAVITTITPANPDSDYAPARVERRHTSYAGPFSTKGAANAAITREKRGNQYWHTQRDITIEAHVEKSSQEWVKVEN